jgi:hypothetical protein
MKKLAFLAMALMLLATSLVAALPVAAYPEPAQNCKWWKDNDPDTFYIHYKNVGQCVRDDTVSAWCKYNEATNPDWFYARWDNHGDCVSHCESSWNNR